MESFRYFNPKLNFSIINEKNVILKCNALISERGDRIKIEIS